jgi:hypothetical protein
VIEDAFVVSSEPDIRQRRSEAALAQPRYREIEIAATQRTHLFFHLTVIVPLLAALSLPAHHVFPMHNSQNEVI